MTDGPPHATDSLARGPGVRFPPPLVYLVAFVLAHLVGTRWPWPLSVGMRPSIAAALELLGLALLVLALALGAWAGSTLRRAGTTLAVHRRAATLVTHGPYNFSRNPIYLGMTIAYAGVTFLVDDWWPLVALPLVIAIIRFAVIGREERHLRHVFGDSYANYAARVHRWL